MDVTPSVHLLRALSNQNLNWFKALAELVDNAFDANANRVLMTMNQKQLTIEDDGDGMKDIWGVLRLGDHQPSETTSLGMYGVGLKDAWLFAGDRIEIETVRGGFRSRVYADVSEMIKAKSWEIDDPRSIPADIRDKTGTTIKLFLNQRRMPGQSSMESLAWAFTPALMLGKQIAYRKGSRKAKTLAPVQLPQFVKSVTDEFDVSGKHVSIEIGIVGDGQKMTRGPYWIQYKHRNLASSHIGTGQGFSSSRMGGVIRLGEGFAITKNKDDFMDHNDELHDAIHSRIKFLLQEADQLAVDVESKALTTELESRINEAIGQLKREKRHQTREVVGAVLPKSTGRRRRKASEISDLPGGVDDSEGKRRRGLSLGFYDMGDDSMGDFDPSSNRITLNESHPYIAHCRSENIVEALHTIAIAILTNFACHNQGRQLTFFEVEDFNLAYGAIMKPMAANVEVRNAKRSG